MSLPFKKSLLPLFILTCGLSAQSFASYNESSAIKAFKDSWTGRVLQLQREIDLNTPLREATFLGTHNSYNSKSYQTPVRYIDPNQNLSLYDQLEAGVRSIELDAHWAMTNHFSKDILLCHAKANHVGCGVFDRQFGEGLAEVRDWLKANPKEVVLMYIERHLDGHEPRLAAELDKYLGNFIYRPNQVRKSGENPKSCVSLSTDITKADILKSGKQIMIVVTGCDGTDPDYQEKDKFPQIWNDTVFAGIGHAPDRPYNWVEEMIGDFTHYPDCGKSTNKDTEHSSLWRIYEDRTLLTDIIHPQKKLQAEDMKELVYCGINWPTMDMLTVGDDRFTAAIWSWAATYPQEGKGNCAIYKQSYGFENVPCDSTAGGFVCQEENTHNLRAIAANGSWANGEALCQSNAGKAWHFALPVNGKQMNTIRDQMSNLSLSEVWLNYTMASTGKWVANGDQRV